MCLVPAGVVALLLGAVTAPGCCPAQDAGLCQCRPMALVATSWAPWEQAGSACWNCPVRAEPARDSHAPTDPVVVIPVRAGTGDSHQAWGLESVTRSSKPHMIFRSGSWSSCKTITGAPLVVRPAVTCHRKHVSEPAEL